MGGKSRSKPKVPYYYMTIHYGLCHGPLNAINQIKIKGKPIFCGNMVAPGIIYTHLPELFGGPAKEGGVSGAIECYFGTEDQAMSQDVAIRFGRTTLTMPGYRGVANAFFRGYTDAEKKHYRPGGGSFAHTFSSLVATLGDMFNAATARVSGGGFHWAVNNPYLPPASIHVTRIGQPIAEIPAAVQHLPGEGNSFIEGDFYSYYTGADYTEIDVSAFASSIDAGGVVLYMTQTLTCRFTGLAGGGPAPVTNQVQGIGIKADGSLAPPYVEGESTWIVSNNTPGGSTVEMTRTLTPGTRRLRIWGRFVPSIPLFSVTNVTRRYFSVTFPSLGPLLCKGVPNILGTPPDMNPAQIIAECLTNRQWGMGAPLETLDMASFISAGERLQSESFGLSMMWAQQTTIEKFITEVLDHIQGNLFIDPSTGLWTLRLIRDDYDPETLRVLSPTNCNARNRQRKAEGEVINEIVISYTDPISEEAKTVTYHDLAGIAQLGQIVSETRNYYGIRSERLANFVGARDIRSASYPLFSCEIEADRSFRDVRPGDVLKLSWPEDGIVEMIVRVFKVNYGAPGDAKIRFNVSEDIFGLPLTTFSTIARTQWEAENDAPVNLAHQRVIEAPVPLLLRSGATTDDIGDDDYPEVATILLGDDPSQQVSTISIWGERVQPNGTVVMDRLADIPPTPTGVLDAPLADEAATSLPGSFVRAAAFPEEVEGGDFFYLDGSNETGEIIMLDTYDSGTDTWTAARGMFDTIPRAWPAGTILWFLGTELNQFDPTANSAGVPTNFKLLPRTAGGLLGPDDATNILYVPSERPYLPFRPANTQIDGGGFAPRRYAENLPGGIPATVPLTWANRNRLMEDGVAPRWTDPNVTPEGGQTVTIRAYEQFSQVLVGEWTGLTGTSFDLPTAALVDFRFYEIEFVAVRDSLESLQKPRRVLELERLGYGNNYGYDYGENNGG